MISRTRLTGFNAPFDVEETIKKLMKAERVSRDKVEQKQISNKYIRDEYLSVNSQLLALQKKASEMKLQSNFNLKTSTVSNNPSAVLAKVTPGTINGSYTVAVNRVATKASVTSDEFISDPATFSETSALKSQGAKMTVGSIDDNYKFEINGVAIEVDATKDSMNSVITAINNSSAGVTAVFDKVSGKINLQAKTAGHTNGVTKNEKDISFKDINGSFLENVVRLTTDTSDPSINPGVVNKSADDASITVNGITMVGKTNDFTVNGLNISAVQVTGATPAVIDIKSNTQGMIDKVKEFVKAYNETIVMLNAKYTERHDRNYTPLTKEQRSELGDKEIELWDAEAKKGLLHQEAIVGGARSDLRLSQINKFAFDTASIEGESILNGFGEISLTSSLKSQQTKLSGTILSNGAGTADYQIKVNGVSISIDSDTDSMSDIVSKINNSGAGVKASYDQKTGKISMISNNPGSVNGPAHNEPNITLEDVTGDFTKVMKLSTSGAVNNAPTTTKYQSMGSIGISTTDWRDNGLLTVDEEELKKALEDDPDAVLKMFTNNSTIREQKGFAFRIYDTVSDHMSDITKKAGTKSTAEDQSNLGLELQKINKKLDGMDRLLQKKEDRYYRMFSQMEVAMQRYQSQASYFS